MIIEWWETLSVMDKVLWGVTLSASLVFVIELIMTFLGVGGDSDFDMPDDLSSDGGIDTSGNLYTFRNLVNFVLGFGWSMILLQERISSYALLLVVSALVGAGLVTIVMYLFKWLATMQQSGNINLSKSAVGCQGKVYLTVPAERSAYGKVQITINSSVREYDALTDGDELPTGAAIKVVEVIDNNTLLVEPLNSLII